jgi:hypothetical protein
MIEVNHISAKNTDISTPISMNRQDIKSENES